MSSRGLAVEKLEWHVLRNCQIIPNASNDGDSFHVRHGEDHIFFRICFVDAPETSRAFPHRNKEQALWWGISEDDVLRYGKAAKVFSMAALKDGFTIYTQYKDARGNSSMKRNFAMVEVKGEFLCEALVREGLGRAYGYLPDLPDGTSRWDYRKKLQKLEKKAKKGGKGSWAAETQHVEDVPVLAEKEEGRAIKLTHPVAFYADNPSAHFLGTLKQGLTVLVLDPGDGEMVRVRAPFHGHAVVGQCRKRNLE